MQPLILITGPNGLLGTLLVNFFKSNPTLPYRMIGLHRSAQLNLKELENSDKNWVSKISDKFISISGDLQDGELTDSILNVLKPDWIINLAAATHVDECEANPEQAYQNNILVAKNLAAYIVKNNNCKLIHISTDHVYDGDGYKNESQISIKNIYALTKKAAEDFFPLNQSLILRTNFFGKSLTQKYSLSDWVYNSYSQEKKISLFTDSFFTPVHWSVLAKVILNSLKNFKPGIFNVGCSNGVSKAEFALSIANAFHWANFQYDLKVSSRFPLRARRPLNMQMNSSLFEKTFSFSIGTFQDQLNLLVKEYQ